MTTLKTLAGACALALLAALAGPGQTAPPPYGPPIGIENARKVMTAAEAEAAKNNWAVVIAIIDSGGHIVMLHRRDDTQLSSIEIAQGKAQHRADVQAADQGARRRHLRRRRRRCASWR